MIHADRQKTAARFAALEAYYMEHVLADDTFRCRHCAACQDSYQSAAGRFIPGQLNAPGTHYDLDVDGQPLRIVLVGQESGTGIRHSSMAQRRAAITRVVTEQRFVAEPGYRARTQHMKGITSALRLLFGKGLGTAYADEFLSLTNGEEIHLLHCFALVNYLLCSAHSTKRSKRGESTATMRRNCNEHFRATLEILEPTVMIVGGKAMWPSVRRAFDEVTAVDDQIYRARIDATEMLVALFTHPSAMHPHNWGTNHKMPYLFETVVPTIRKLQTIVGSGNNRADV